MVNPNSDFSIDANGIIRTARTFDYDDPLEAKQYVFTVTTVEGEVLFDPFSRATVTINLLVS